MYVSQWSGGAWQIPMNLGPTVNTAFNDMGPSVNTCNNILYFHSDRPGGQGDFDLYSSDYVFGVWTAPQNLGPIVNSALIEEWPSISSDGKTLYFDSGDIWETSCVLHNERCFRR